MMAGMHPEEVELLAYLEGELDDPRRAEVVSHLETCDRCAQEVRSVEAGRAASARRRCSSCHRSASKRCSHGCRPELRRPRSHPSGAPRAPPRWPPSPRSPAGRSCSERSTGATMRARAESHRTRRAMRVAVANLLPTTGEHRRTTRQELGTLLRADSVAGSPATVARRLRSDGFDAAAPSTAE